jgi:hypothetical protein
MESKDLLWILALQKLIGSGLTVYEITCQQTLGLYPEGAENILKILNILTEERLIKGKFSVYDVRRACHLLKKS